MKKIGMVSLITAVILGLGCSGVKDLSRGRAKDLLEKAYTPDAISFKIMVLGDGTLWPAGGAITAAECKHLRDNQFFSVVDVPLYSSTCCPRQVEGSKKEAQLSPSGEKFFSGSQDGTFRTVFKVRPKIEVTGIKPTVRPTLMEVDYTMDWFADFPSELKPIFQDRAPVATSTVMTLYDDGWRVGQ